MADALHLSFVEKTTTLKENVDTELLRSMREGVPQDLTGVPKREKQENDAIPKVAPKWLKHDRQVSRIQMAVGKTPSQNSHFILYYKA